MQEKARIFKSSWCYSRFLLHFSIRMWPILCLRIPVLQSKEVILIRSTPTYFALSPTKPDQNMTNLRCTTDHHTVSPLNIRPVESGIIPDHFSNVEKLIPLTTTSQSGPDQSPLYFRPTYALPDQGPLIADPSTIYVYMDLCASSVSIKCEANRAPHYVSVFRRQWGPICGCPTFLMQKNLSDCM